MANQNQYTLNISFLYKTILLKLHYDVEIYWITILSLMGSFYSAFIIPIASIALEKYGSLRLLKVMSFFTSVGSIIVFYGFVKKSYGITFIGQCILRIGSGSYICFTKIKYSWFGTYQDAAVYIHTLQNHLMPIFLTVCITGWIDDLYSYMLAITLISFSTLPICLLLLDFDDCNQASDVQIESLMSQIVRTITNGHNLLFTIYKMVLYMPHG